MDEFKINVYRYDKDGIMINVENPDEQVYADSDMWIKASDIETLYKEVN